MAAEECDPPNICASKELYEHQVAEGVDKLCGRAAKKSEKFDDVRKEAGEQRQKHENCQGELKAERRDSTRHPYPFVLRTALDVAAAAAWLVSGILAGSSVDGEVKIASIVASTLILGFRFVLEF